MEKIPQLTENDIGKRVVYYNGLGEVESKGKIKSFSNERQIAWIVFNANNNWHGDHRKDYTAESVNYSDLSLT